jgi:hypothetical protein
VTEAKFGNIGKIQGTAQFLNGNGAALSFKVIIKDYKGNDKARRRSFSDLEAWITRIV